MKVIAETSINQEAEKIKQKFRDLLAKANKENPRPSDAKALSGLLYQNKGLELHQLPVRQGL